MSSRWPHKVCESCSLVLVHDRVYTKFLSACSLCLAMHWPVNDVINPPMVLGMKKFLYS